LVVIRDRLTLGGTRTLAKSSLGKRDAQEGNGKGWCLSLKAAGLPIMNLKFGPAARCRREKTPRLSHDPNKNSYDRHSFSRKSVRKGTGETDD